MTIIQNGNNLDDDGKCPICGADTHIEHILSVIGQVMTDGIICPNCGDVTDAVFDGFMVGWDDLDHSHDEEVN
jgi:hypothetical protein